METFNWKALSSLAKTSYFPLKQHSGKLGFRRIHSTRVSRNLGQQLESDKVQESYKILEVDAGCSEEELRAAYLLKVKTYHPDNQTMQSSASKFVQVQHAYKTVVAHKQGQKFLEEEEEKNRKEEEMTMSHTVPQHRRYLTLEGIGFGTPASRQRQYKQFRVARATETVYEHRKLKFGSDESSVVVKDKAQARKIKISNLIDRVVDDLIRESMQRGDFDNLAGKGKPLDYSSHNPLVDTTTHNLNKILVNNGFKPEWIMLSKEIREEVRVAREKLSVTRELLGAPPHSPESEQRWRLQEQEFKKALDAINTKINKFNFIVPFMEKQMVHFSAENMIDKVLEDHTQYLPRDSEGRPLQASQLSPLPQVKEEDVRIHWGEVWANIKQVFKTRHYNQ